MKSKSRNAAFLSTLIAAGAVAGVLIAPSDVLACGGLFCNSRPPDPFAPLPVAQTGENVVFAIDKDPAGGAPTLTAHIQILYAGAAAKFSWVVPVDAAPTLTVGTDRLFSTLASLTQPRFASQSVIDGQCIPQPTMTTDPRNGVVNGTGPSAAGSGGASGAVSTPVVNVSFQGAVGPFDAAVIQSADPMALKMWLSDNGYIISDQASGLIDAYVRDGKFFVALKLLNGLGVTAIQPIVLTFKGTEPCVPLRLTAIAANPDMQVRMWVLADRRAVPKNFFELKINDARIDWLTGGSNYNALVTQAANDAGGNAFVTDYAGPSAIAAASLWSAGQYNLTALQTAQTPPAYVQALTALGLTNDSQTLPLLAQYIPMPPALKATGISNSQFYGNLSQYWSQYAFPPYDLATLTSEISSKIIEPRHVAQLMIDAHPYLTRLNTFISPEEMNVDPLFIINRDLPEVPVTRTAIFRTMCGNMQFMACNAPIRLELPSGRMAWVRTGSPAAICDYRSTDLTKLRGLPAADVVWQRDEVGEGLRAMDNGVAISAGLLQNNNSFPGEQKMFPIPTQDPPIDGPVTTPPGVQGGGGGAGCACGIAGGPAGTVSFGLLLAGALGILLGRRRSRRRL